MHWRFFFANAWVNDENEAKAKAIAAVRQIWSNADVFSAEIQPEIRAFERFVTTVFNAFPKQEASGVLNRLEAARNDAGFGDEFGIVASNGGVLSAKTAAWLPAQTALSGPAAGLTAAGYVGEAAVSRDVITGGMGGTSFDVSMIARSENRVSPRTRSTSAGLCARR